MGNEYNDIIDDADVCVDEPTEVVEEIPQVLDEDTKVSESTEPQEMEDVKEDTDVLPEDKTVDPGVTEIQMEDAKTYKPPMRDDGWPEHDGFVPDSSQIIIDQAETPEEKEELEKILSGELDEEDDWDFDDTPNPMEEDYDDEYIQNIDKYNEMIDEIDPDEITLKPGMELDRYSWRGRENPDVDTGNYFTTRGTPMESLSLRPTEDGYDCTSYRVLQPFDTKAGIAASAYDLPGGGTQYKTSKDQTVQWLLDNGYIERIED